MATKKTKNEDTQEASAGTALTPWEQEMAALADEAAASASSTGGGSPKIGTRGGRFSIDGQEVEGNAIQVVVLDFLVDVTYYEDDFDADDITAPTAWALGRDEKTLVWDESSHPDYAGEPLKDSPVFQWGSADKGRGKAAKSRRRLLVISESDLEDDIAGAEVRKLTVPVTSGKTWDAYVKQVRAHGRPPCGVLTEVTISPDPKYQFVLKFKMLGTVDDAAMPEILEKRKSIQDDLFAPYAAYEAAPEPPPRKASGKARKGAR